MMRLWRKGNPCILLVGMLNWYNHYGKQYGGFSTNKQTENKNRASIWPSNSTLECVCVCVYIYIYSERERERAKQKQ